MIKKLISFFKKNLRQAVAVLVVVTIVCGYLFFQITRNRINIENSVVSAPIINIAPSAPGKLLEMDAVESHQVKTGDTLAVVGTETIRAQNDGLIVMAQNQTGGNVSNQSPLIQMVKNEDLRIAGTIDENKGLSDIEVGQIVSFTVDAISGKTFWGYVDEVSPTAKQAQLAFSISSERPTQQFVVYARFDSLKYPEIKNGMSAKMTVYTNSN